MKKYNAWISFRDNSRDNWGIDGISSDNLEDISGELNSDTMSQDNFIEFITSNGYFFVRKGDIAAISFKESKENG